MFEKVLIAHHGEAALRVARTCERLGIATVAIHTTADAEAAHVSTCTEKQSVGDGEHAYLDVAAILAATKASGAVAVHPCSGPLASDAAFARAVVESGYTFIGSSHEALGRFGDIAGARLLAVQAGVRILPSAVIDLADHSAALELARELGYPVRLAQAHGALGPALEDSDELLGAMSAAARTGATSALLEHALDRPRRLSVHVVADASGECVALGELEHSIARPPYGLIDESPAPALTGLQRSMLKRQTLASAAVAVALEGGLVGLAAVEFFIDAQARLHFARVIPGLPSDHTLTEICTGLDLVEIQLRIAAGEALPAAARNAQSAGHALQARVYAQQTGETGAARPQVAALRWPPMPPGTLRIDSELVAGMPAATDRDPLLAKVVTHGQTRHQAVLTLDRVLAETTIEPIATNIEQIRQVLADESYKAGQYDVELLARLFP